MHLACNMAKTAKGGFSRAYIKDAKFIIKTPGAEVQEEPQWGD